MPRPSRSPWRAGTALLATTLILPGACLAQIQLAVNGTTLQVTGTAGADTLVAWTVNRAVFLVGFDAAGNGVAVLGRGVDELEVDAGAGSDLVLVEGDIETDLDGEDDADLIVGGRGVDFMDGGDGSDLLIARQGDDWPSGGDQTDFIFGGTGREVMNGDDGADFLVGGSGADLITGGAGNDIAFGGPEDDRIEGGADDDLLFGEDGFDTLLGDDGDDCLCGGLRADELEGNANDDWLWGEQGPDGMDGGPGNDELFGFVAFGDRFARGRVNADEPCLKSKLDGERPPELPRIDATYGGGRVVAGAEAILVLGSDGSDTVSVLAGKKAVLVHVATRGYPDQSFELAASEKGPPLLVVDAGDGADRVTVAGEFLNVVVDAGPGDDVIEAGAANAQRVVLLGGSGEDWIRGAATPGFLVAGPGNDTVISAHGLDRILEGSGHDDIRPGAEPPTVLDRLPVKEFRVVQTDGG